MKRNGLIFFDIIMGLFVISLVVVVLFPILSLTQKSFIHHKKLAQMSYISESTIERLTLKDKKSLEFLEELETYGELEYPYLNDIDYKSIVKLASDNPYLWEISVTVKEAKGGEDNVQLNATIRR
ncbi:hypothetical protein [Tissierella creatinophila]|uniref:Uncharacterized protein n=1 Tax=Tissierella creatinophila DSM 6911 TaxID=1123403 RepID=A0A1U7M9F1_TISCR|nr:hypothetical protein [Tissierella creatinophila]OLS03927.1 hypothetical protein TICRE_00540 [Tissierella creatinophila DSM 6911]